MFTHEGIYASCRNLRKNDDVSRLVTQLGKQNQASYDKICRNLKKYRSLGKVCQENDVFVYY